MIFKVKIVAVDVAAGDFILVAARRQFDAVKGIRLDVHLKQLGFRVLAVGFIDVEHLAVETGAVFVVGGDGTAADRRHRPQAAAVGKGGGFGTDGDHAAAADAVIAHREFGAHAERVIGKHHVVHADSAEVGAARQSVHPSGAGGIAARHVDADDKVRIDQRPELAGGQSPCAASLGELP